MKENVENLKKFNILEYVGGCNMTGEYKIVYQGGEDEVVVKNLASSLQWLLRKQKSKRLLL